MGTFAGCGGDNTDETVEQLSEQEAAGKPVAVWTASGWSQGGVESPEAWNQLVKDFAFAQANPLNVEVVK